MKKYQIEIQEILSEVIEIEAKSVKDAIDKVEQLYKKEEIILDENNHISTEYYLKNKKFNIKDEKNILTNEIIEYLIKDEEKHFEELERKPKNHIFNKLKRLKEINN